MTTADRTRRERERFPYKMKDLCELTGLPRQVIHFYIHEGLVPEGHKTGRNMAFYSEAHVERIQLIRKLQHERFLPLKAIKAMLDEQEEIFSPTQRRLLGEVRARLEGSVRPRTTRPKLLLAAPLLAQAGATAGDLEEMASIGLLATQVDERGRTLVAEEDAWILTTWGELRALGFSRDLGFSPADLAIFEEGISAIFKREAALFASRLSLVGPERLAKMVESALPIINQFLIRYHEAKIRNFFATTESAK